MGVRKSWNRWRGDRQMVWARLIAGTAMMSLAMALTAVPSLPEWAGWFVLPVVLFGAALAVGAYQQIPSYELEQQWQEEHGRFREDLDSLWTIFRYSYRPPGDWFAATRDSLWPIKDQRDLARPLRDWDESQFAQHPASWAAWKFAHATFPSPGKEGVGVFSAIDRAEVRRLRRSLYLAIGRWNDRRHRSNRFSEFLRDEIQVEDHRSVIRYLAYLEIALAKHNQTETAPRNMGFWELGQEWAEGGQLRIKLADRTRPEENGTIGP